MVYNLCVDVGMAGDVVCKSRPSAGGTSRSRAQMVLSRHRPTHVCYFVGPTADVRSQLFFERWGSRLTYSFTSAGRLLMEIPVWCEERMHTHTHARSSRSALRPFSHPPRVADVHDSEARRACRGRTVLRHPVPRHKVECSRTILGRATRSFRNVHPA